MLNIHELERAWLRYKIKHLLPRIIAPALAVIAAAVAVLYWSGISEKKNITEENPDKQYLLSAKDSKETVERSVPVTPSTPQTLSAEKTIQPPTQKQSSAPVEIPSQNHSDKAVTTLKPSMNFIRNIENDSAAYHSQQQIKAMSPKPHKGSESKVSEHVSVSKTTHVPEKKTAPAAPEKTVVTAPIRVESIPEEQAVVSVPKRPAITIVAKQDEDDLNDVIRRFKKNKNPALSLFIAKRYYETNRYQKAYNYALITNDIDSKIEDSWIIFAKSLVKLDQKEMAIKALASYVEASDSARAKILLDEINKGGFR